MSGYVASKQSHDSSSLPCKRDRAEYDEDQTHQVRQLSFQAPSEAHFPALHRHSKRTSHGNLHIGREIRPESESLSPSRTMERTASHNETESTPHSQQRQPSQRQSIEAELQRRRTAAEEEYASRLSSLSEAARALELVLRSESEASTAQSRRSDGDLGLMLSRAVELVSQVFASEKRSRDGLSAELRAATAVYNHTQPPPHPPRQQALKGSNNPAASQLMDHQQHLQGLVVELMEQLQTERESHSTAVQRAAEQFNAEKAKLVSQLHSQASEMAQLKARMPEQDS